MEVGEINLRDLCRTPGKAETFACDAGFLFALSLATGCGDARFQELTSACTFAVLKPDSFAFGKALQALEFFERQGLSIIGCREIWLTEQSMLALWRYQWNCATSQRMAVSLCIGMMRSSLLILFRDHSSTGEIPTSVRIWSMKGSASPQGRPGNRLRSILGVEGRYFGYVHVPDEPADVVRELAVLLGADGFRETLEHDETASDISGKTRQWIIALEQRWRVSWSSAQPPCRTLVTQKYPEDLIPFYLQIAGRAKAKREPTFEEWEEDWIKLANVIPHICDNRGGIKPLLQSSGFADPVQQWCT